MIRALAGRADLSLSLLYVGLWREEKKLDKAMSPSQQRPRTRRRRCGPEQRKEPARRGRLGWIGWT